jgi:hypothetical protein
VRSVSATVARRLRVARRPFIGVAGCVLWAVVPALPAGGATVPELPASGVSTPDGSWSTLPMGQLSEQSNTFWELFHALPGSSRWTLVTPEGTADNGGLVAGVSGDSVAAGVLPSELLRFSPLSSSSDGGSSWSPVFLPGGLARLPDALAIESSGTRAGLAVMRDGTVLAAAKTLGSWAPLVTTTVLRKAAPACDVAGIAAVAFSAAGAPLVAAGCERGRRVGLFSQTDESWHLAGPTLTTGGGRGATGVLRLETSGEATTLLATVGGAGHQALEVAWTGNDSGWTMSAPLLVPSADSVRASAVGADGRVAVLVSGPKSKRAVYEVGPSGRAWSSLPPPPTGATGLALPGNTPTVDAPPVDVFSVDGSALRVFELTPSGATWSRVQSTTVPISYGSSS